MLTRYEQQMLKTHPRQRMIHKLFASFTTSLFGSARPYSEENLLTLTLKDFTLASFPAKNAISLVFKVLNSPRLVFALLVNTNTIQYLHSIFCEDSMNPNQNSSLVNFQFNDSLLLVER